MPLSESELQLIPQFEKLSVSLELTGHHSEWKSPLSTAEKKKIIQIARIINHEQCQVSPRQKFRKNLEKSIENHMKRMAMRTGKNIRIIRPPPQGLKVLKNGEWSIPKSQLQAYKTTEERAKQLLSQVPMTIPEIEIPTVKRTGKSKISLKKKSKTRDEKKKPLSGGEVLSYEQHMKRFRKVFKTFLKKRTEFMSSVRMLQRELEDIRFEQSATSLISKSLSQTNVDMSESRVLGKPLKKLKRKNALKYGVSCPELSGRNVRKHRLPTLTKFFI